MNTWYWLSVHHILSRELQAVNCSPDGSMPKSAAPLQQTHRPEGGRRILPLVPESMIHDIRDTLTEMGVDKGKIHFELFIAST